MKLEVRSNDFGDAHHKVAYVCLRELAIVLCNIYLCVLFNVLCVSA